MEEVSGVKLRKVGMWELKAEISQLKKKVAIHRAEVESLERLMREYKEEDQEEKYAWSRGWNGLAGFWVLSMGLRKRWKKRPLLVRRMDVRRFGSRGIE
jgi:hypothetical protein